MRRAILLSAHGIGSTSPNPPVGCVILDAEGAIVGEGYHERKGESHAEVHALRAAGNRARGGSAVVTLEPCNHVGRTPACHQAIIDAKITNVIVALKDPTSRGNGGVALLRRAGINVDVGVLAGEARLVIGPWLDALEDRRPFITLAYQVSTNDIWPIDEKFIDERRYQFDAILNLAESSLEEGRTGAHPPDVMRLPVLQSPYDPNPTLETLYASGVRSLLLLGPPDLVEPFLAGQAVDRIEVHSTLATGSSGQVANWACLPTGYRWTSFTRTSTGVLGHAVRNSANAMSGGAP
ncbi:bifunctional diaminohydroxyphosphoribosylaminopyrimidine deaminase/5-amino-6-(5-phosphoribosylamino)uracil reductase RibD [Pseudonocardia acaciae]|uniref:bifunctional diaminohydroxyphosphoribosylaminopyrimidine deaminase/5-amino-6-(5-phosphoribosylamino)uracil reductase RibD n=1 Tax=Pseudonocardia acaciae TaxID=551276 RepID=UPI0009FCDE0E|nr:bifunctional diaminohydroxyphosphoribosylaminopyrimidine deaminase/5-amino-6-(5-phosphoribosylamino)uracil reductase RibD [Pseudonocardia acaciae]